MASATGSLKPGSAAGASGRWARHAVGWAFASPFTALWAGFAAFPILASLLLSFTDFGVGDLTDPTGAEVVGLENYLELFLDAGFRQAAWNTALIVVAGVPITLGGGLLLAVALDKGIKRLRGLFRVGYYLPLVTSVVAIAVVWRYILNADVGLINNALALLGIDGPNWLADPGLAMPCIILLVVWRNLGTPMVIYLAALQGVDPQLYEAARVDGAGPVQIFRRITLPLLRPATLFLMVITTAGYLQVFDEPFVMTGGGPLSKTTTVAMIAYEEGFNFFNLGYASAISYLLFLVIAVLTGVQFRLLRSQT